MRRLLPVLLACAALCSRLAAPAAGADGWDALYASRLASSAACLEAGLSLRGAEIDLLRFDKPYLPTVAIVASTQAPLSLNASGFSSGTLTPSITLENILGADLLLRAPVTASSGGLALGDPSISLTRKLFVESAADRLDAEAALWNARSALWNAESAVRMALATEVLNAKYYGSLLEANEANLAVLEKVRSATVDSYSLREVERRVLGARKSILAASSALAGIDPAVTRELEILYADVLRQQAIWAAAGKPDSPSADVPPTPAIRALELSLASAEKRGAFAILPHLPNPSLTASLAYDISSATLGWGLSMSMSYTALDSGRTALNALRREMTPRILAGRLDDARRTLSDNIRRIRNTLATLELDRKIKEFDLADAEDEFRTYDALFQGGYTTEESRVIAQIDVSIERLAARKIDHDILIQTLSLAQYYGTGR